MDLIDLKTQLNRIEAKLDSHIERITQTETDMKWVKGAVKVGMTLILTVLSGLISLLFGTK